MDILKDHDSAQSLRHLGFVVADVAAGMEGFVRSLAAELDRQVYEDPHQKVRVAFLTTRPADPSLNGGGR